MTNLEAIKLRRNNRIFKPQLWEDAVHRMSITEDLNSLIDEVESLQTELAKTQRLLDVTELAEAEGRIEIERLQKLVETLQAMHFKELEGEKAENRRLQDALEFYADTDWYHLKQGDEVVVLKDGGDIAREALGLAGESND